MRYLLFAGHDYYPCGGVDDLKMRGETVEECIDWFNSQHDMLNLEWGHIVDTMGSGCELEVIARTDCPRRTDSPAWTIEEGC